MSSDPIDRKPDPLQAFLGPLEDIELPEDTSDQGELFLDNEPGTELARLQREHRILLQTVRKTEYYLGRHIEPGGMSARDCITALLRVVDNDEINEVTKRHEQ